MTDVTFRAIFVTWDRLSFYVLEIELIHNTFYYLNMCAGFHMLIDFFKITYHRKNTNFIIVTGVTVISQRLIVVVVD